MTYIAGKPRERRGLRISALHLLFMACTTMYAASPEVAVGQLSADSLPDSYCLRKLPPATEQPIHFDETSRIWWHHFEDSTLVALVHSAVENNYNVQAAIRRIDASKASLAGTRASYYPSISLNAGYDYNRDSGRIVQPYADADTKASWTLGASLSWEIDIFGRIHEKLKGSRAQLRASRLEYEGVMLSLAAEVANDYSRYRMYQNQLRVARNHLNSQARMLDLVETRFKEGLVSKLDVAQARNTLNLTKALIPDLEANISTTFNALVTLCNMPVDEITELLASETFPLLTVPLDLGSPAELLSRRPDIAGEAQQIQIVGSKLGIAKKDYLPTLSISALVQTMSHNLQEVFGAHSLHWSVVPTLSWTLFDGFSRSANVAEAKAEMEAEIDNYNMTVTTAVQEVNNSIVDYNAAMRRMKLYETVVTDSEEVLHLATERYKLGLTDFSEVATAQISLLNSETNYESTLSACFQSIVTIYKAIGGGWIKQ